MGNQPGPSSQRLKNVYFIQLKMACQTLFETATNPQIGNPPCIKRSRNKVHPPHALAWFLLLSEETEMEGFGIASCNREQNSPRGVDHPGKKIRLSLARAKKNRWRV
jgi:hypothetical protein